jgi:DNA invertase Pin-like site-specific DNA recombinase
MNEEALKPIAIRYARVSTKRQANDGYSIPSQFAQIELAKGVERYSLLNFQETGSASGFYLPVLGQALEMLKSGQAEALFVADVDRLTRSKVIAATILKFALVQGWHLGVASIACDVKSEAGSREFHSQADLAQAEHDLIVRRVKRQHEARRDRGIVWGSNQGPRSPLPASTIAQVVQLRSEGLTMQAIADRLTAENVPTATGGKWFAQTVSNVLKSPAQRISA